MRAGPPVQHEGCRSQRVPLEALLFQSCVPVRFASNSRVSACDCLAHRFGNAGDRPERARRYPSDMTDAEWVVVRDALPVPAWLEGRGGQPEGYCHRQMLDAVFYVTDNGIKWRAMPVDFLLVTWNQAPQDASRILRRSHVLRRIRWAARWCWRRSGRSWAGMSGQSSG